MNLEAGRHNKLSGFFLQVFQNLCILMEEELVIEIIEIIPGSSSEF